MSCRQALEKEDSPARVPLPAERELNEEAQWTGDLFAVSYPVAPSSRKLSWVPPWLFGAADPPHCYTCTSAWLSGLHRHPYFLC